MKLSVTLFATALPMCLAGCDRGDTDVGDLETMTGGVSGTGSTGAPEETSATDPLECAGEGEACEDGCCEGFGCNFMAVCEACTPAGNNRGVDGSGCCEGLAETPAGYCYASSCPDGVCPEGVAQCVGLAAETVNNDPEGFVKDCAPEACLSSNEALFTNAAEEPFLQCAGPLGSEDCAAEEGAWQQYSYTNGGLSLTLGFDRAILDGYSTEAFNEHLENVAGSLTVPGATVPLRAFIGSHTPPSELLFADGRLQFTIPIELDNAFEVIESDADDCISDDILGECACFYDELGVFNVVVDLEIEAP